MSQVTLSAIVTGFPAGLRQPKPQPGETLVQLVIRNHAQEWRACVERLAKDLHVPEEVCARLREGDTTGVVDPAAWPEIEQFMNQRLPSHGRTLQGLADLRKRMLESGGLSLPWRLELSEIIWPRQRNPTGDRSAEMFAESLGAVVVSVDSEKPGPLDLGSLLQHIHGDYIWILPGGSRLSGPRVSMALTRVIRGFQERPKVALYSDQCYSMVYRTAALRALIANGKTLSAELRDNAVMLQQAGFELAADSDSIHSLVEIEPVYREQHEQLHKPLQEEKRTESPAERTPWWKRMMHRE